jgi:Fur family transcriptional regulator, peroxide stress response regulator
MPPITLDHAAAAEASLRRALEANGQRYTEQRAEVFRYLRGTRAHPTADEVFTAVRGKLPDISLATVYKALETLVSCRLAIKLSFGDGSARYDSRTEDHCHARCLVCGVVSDLHDADLDRLVDSVTHTTFAVEGISVEVTGRCPACAG